MGRELIESFDELLEGNRQALESLYNRSSTSSEGAVDSGANDSVAPARERGEIKRFDKDELAEIDAVDWLDRHYPGEWRHDGEPLGRVVQGEANNQGGTQRGFAERKGSPYGEPLSEIVQADTDRHQHCQLPTPSVIRCRGARAHTSTT